MNLVRFINLSKYIISGLQGDAEYEIFGFIDISGTDLKSCSYKSVFKKWRDIWVVQDGFSTYEINQETALKTDFCQFLIFFERCDKSII